MAGGILGFLGFGKSRKTNLTPDVPRPKATDLYFNKPLRELAYRRIGGQDLGFGADFVDKATNPTVRSRMTRLREDTIPTIANEASARGINRSSLTVDRIGRAERDTQNDIDELLARFEVLNRQQSKTDQNNAIQLGREMDTQEAGLLENEAAASERLVDKTANRADARNIQDRERQNNALQAVGSFASPMLNDLYAKIAPNAQTNKDRAAMNSFLSSGGRSGIMVDTLGSTSDMDLISTLLKQGLSIQQVMDMVA